MKDTQESLLLDVIQYVQKLKEEVAAQRKKQVSEALVPQPSATVPPFKLNEEEMLTSFSTVSRMQLHNMAARKTAVYGLGECGLNIIEI